MTQMDLLAEPVRVPDRGTVAYEILMALKQGQKLTPLVALQQFGCLSLSQRIGELKRKGWPIISEMVEVGVKRVAQYRMVA
jgi:Helix-turn-helix domain